MKSTQYIWKNGRLILAQDATVHVLAHGLHYGSAVFEGIRFYDTPTGPAIFKLEEHICRLFYSASVLAMQPSFTQQEICDAVVRTVAMNRVKEGYIRPLIYYSQGSLKVVPESQIPIETVIACWPWGDYFAADFLDVKTSQYIRIHPKSTVTDAKICGHYVNSILAGLEIKNTHYHEVLLLDSDGYVTEGGGENIFIVKDNELITPPLGNILKGITRDTVIEIADYLNIPVIERHFTPDEVISADEAFFCGTAVEVVAIRSLDDHIIADGTVGPITRTIKGVYQQIVGGYITHFHHRSTLVPASMLEEPVG